MKTLYTYFIASNKQIHRAKTNLTINTKLLTSNRFWPFRSYFLQTPWPSPKTSPWCRGSLPIQWLEPNRSSSWPIRLWDTLTRWQLSMEFCPSSPMMGLQRQFSNRLRWRQFRLGFGRIWLSNMRVEQKVRHFSNIYFH